jgi:hypothetical protein
MGWGWLEALGECQTLLPSLGHEFGERQCAAQRRDGDPGVPVRPGPCPGTGAHAAFACWRGPVRLELGLARCQQRYQAEGSWYPGIELHKLWNAGKKADPALAWWAENSKCVYQEAFRDLDRALRDFIRSKKGQRKGKRLGFPRFKKRGRCRESFRFSTGAIGCAGTTVTMPRLGTICTHESTGKLARRLGAGDARLQDHMERRPADPR